MHIGAEMVGEIRFDISPYMNEFKLTRPRGRHTSPHYEVELDIFFEINGVDVGVFAKTKDGRTIPGSVKWFPINAAFPPGAS